MGLERKTIPALATRSRYLVRTNMIKIPAFAGVSPYRTRYIPGIWQGGRTARYSAIMIKYSGVIIILVVVVVVVVVFNSSNI